MGGGAPNGFHQLLTNFACEKLQQEYLLDMCAAGPRPSKGQGVLRRRLTA